MSIQPDLLSCPFCGSQPMILGMDRAQHPVAGCILSGRTIAAREFREWNKRTQLPDAGQLCNSTVEMAECAAFSAGYEAGQRDGRARPMCDAPKDGTPVLVKIKDDLSPWGVNQSSFSNSHMFCGLYAVMRNYGDIQDWGFAAPVGRGGFPDEWLDGWWPLPDRAALVKGGA